MTWFSFDNFNDLVLKVATSDAKFDGRDFIGLNRTDKQGYLDRSRAALVAIDMNRCEHEPDASAFIDAAKEEYAVSSDDDIEVNDDAMVSASDDGAFVMGWLWVTNEQAGIDDPGSETFAVEQVEPGLFQSVFPTRLAQLSQLHTSNADAWEYIKDQEALHEVDDDDNVCRTCCEEYAEGGDGFDGECPDCADKTDQKLHPENYE